MKKTVVKSYFFSAILILSILLGGLTGYFIGNDVQWLKPLGDIFLNLIYTAIVPLIFFSVSTAIAKTSRLGRTGKTFFSMAVVFIFTSIVAAALAIVAVKLFPPAQGVYIPLSQGMNDQSIHFMSQFANIFTVSEFAKLLSHQNILALIVFSMLVGFAAASSQEHGKVFISFLQAGEAVFLRVFAFIMYYAPIGFFAYFAVLINELGPKIMSSYLRVTIIYYVFAVFYFFFIYTLFAYVANNKEGIKLFWRNVLLPAVTGLATCSSAASIPANLVATKAMQVPDDIAETVVPLGAIIHKDGSVIGGVIKIAFLFGLFQLDFTGTSVLLMALGVSFMVGTVMGAIPSGGMLGELLILHVYGFPASALIVIAAISIIIDPIATMLNVTGNSVSSMLVARVRELFK